ncbi:MAG: PEP-CTERM sorting domain-containing protein [Fimbriimonadales bacterium]|nr:PEP-CTERM sorting domain-containing protein [Fimbriimonadales bacterium]
MADHFRGSGSVICVGQLPDGTRRFAFLTADHVIGSPVRNDPFGGAAGEYRPYGNSNLRDPLLPGLKIAFGNNPTTYHSIARNNLGQPLVFRGGPTGLKDYAVLIVDYNGDEGDEFFRILSRNALSVGAINHPEGKEMTSVGFGVTGVNDGTGYVHRYVSGANDPDFGVYGWGTKRFWNNKIERVDPNRRWKLYAYDAFEVSNTMPGGVGAVAGEGIGASGDSGAPYLFEGEAHIVVDGLPIRVRSHLIGGVHTGGEVVPIRDDPRDPNAETGFRKPWGSLGYGVRFDQADVNWIMGNCVHVPEPASVAALCAGLSGLLFLRRRRRGS